MIFPPEKLDLPIACLSVTSALHPTRHSRKVYPEGLLVKGAAQVLVPMRLYANELQEISSRERGPPMAW